MPKKEYKVKEKHKEDAVFINNRTVTLKDISKKDIDYLISKGLNYLFVKA